MITQKGFKPIETKTERKLILYGPDGFGEWEPVDEYTQATEDMIKSSGYNRPYRIMEALITTEYRIIKEQK